MPSEVFTAFTGIRGLKANLNDSLFYDTKKYTREKNAIKTTFHGFIDDANITEDQIVQGFVDANNTLFKFQQGLYAKIKAARDLGVDENTIREMIVD